MEKRMQILEEMLMVVKSMLDTQREIISQIISNQELIAMNQLKLNPNRSKIDEQTVRKIQN